MKLLKSNPNVDPRIVCEFCGVDLDDGIYHTPGCANEPWDASAVGSSEEWSQRNGIVVELVDTTVSKTVSERSVGSSPTYAINMNANNVWQNVVIVPEMESREEQSKLVQELLTLVEGESSEIEEYYQEYYHLMADLFRYDYCMSDNFKSAFMDEIKNSITFEKEWRDSLI